MGRRWAGAGSRPVGPGVECVSKAVAEQVEGEHGDQQEEPWEQPEPPDDVEVLERVADHAPPGGRVVGHAEPQEGEVRLEEDVGRDQERRVDDDRRDQVREDLPEHDPQVARTERARGLHELALAQRQRVAAYEPGDVGPGEERDDHDHHAEARLQRAVEAAVLGRGARRHDPDREQEQRHREDDVGDPGDDRVDPAAEEAGQDAEDDPHRDRDRGGEHAHHQRDARAVDRAHEDVAPVVVGSEPEARRRSVGDPEDVGGLALEELVGPVTHERREQRREDGHEDQEDDQSEPREREAVLREALPEELPRRLSDDLMVVGRRSGGAAGAGLRLRGAHSPPGGASDMGLAASRSRDTTPARRALPRVSRPAKWTGNRGKTPAPRPRADQPEASPPGGRLRRRRIMATTTTRAPRPTIVPQRTPRGARIAQQRHHRRQRDQPGRRRLDPPQGAGIGEARIEGVALVAGLVLHGPQANGPAREGPRGRALGSPEAGVTGLEPAAFGLVRQVAAILRRALSDAVRARLIPRNPAEDSDPRAPASGPTGAVRGPPTS